MLARRDRIVRGFLRHRLVVTMDDDKTWAGVVMEADDRTVVLREVEAVQKDGTRVRADGEVLLPRDQISYMQSVPEMQRP